MINFDLLDVIPMYMKKICLSYAPHRNKGNLNQTQIKVLIAVGKKPGISMKELSEMIMIDQGALSRIIKKLSDRKIIKKEISETDRRMSYLYVDSEGLPILADNMEKFEEHINAIFSNFTSEENEEFIGALKILKKYLERIE